MYYFGRIIGAFFNQFFRWLFWNKTGQKFLFSILIVFIFFCFIKLGEVSAVEQVEDINYKARIYYDGVCNNAILWLDQYWDTIDSNVKTALLDSQTLPYFYYGNQDGSSLNNAQSFNTSNLYYARIYRDNNLGTISNNDFLGITGHPMYQISTYVFRLNYNGGSTWLSTQQIYYPLFVRTYTPLNLVNYLNARRNNDVETITALLEDIKAEQQATNEALTNTTPTSETDSFVNVDTSSTDTISSTAVDNVASNVLTNLENKVNNYNSSTDYSFVWNIMGTSITFHSNMIYNLIKDTFLYDLIQMLWFFVTGHYCFAFLSNLIHSIKDGSILDGFHPNEVISKEVL